LKNINKSLVFSRNGEFLMTVGTMEPEEVAKKFFNAETFVDILSSHNALRDACGVQGYGRQVYETIKSRTVHRHQCKGLWDILDRKRNSSKTYKAEVRLKACLWT
jgi:hypothetical protein